MKASRNYKRRVVGYVIGDHWAMGMLLQLPAPYKPFLYWIVMVYYVVKITHVSSEVKTSSYLTSYVLVELTRKLC